MRFSTLCGGIAALTAAAVLAACSGQGAATQSTLPTAPGVAGATGLSPDLMIPNAPSPCQVPKLYYFKGSCKPFVMNLTKQTVVQLGQFGAYHGIKINATLSAFTSPPKGVTTVKAIMADAVGNGDIVPPAGGKPFPLFVNGKPVCVDGNGHPINCKGTPFVYAELINLSSYTLTPLNTPGLYITDTNGFPGHTLCFPALLTSKGWAMETNLGAKPVGDTLNLSPARNNGTLIFPPNGQFIVAGVCY